MALTIKSGASTDEMTVDATSKAARSTLYNTDGTPVYASYTGAYITPIQIVPTVFAAGTTYFSMRNNSLTQSVHIHRILLNASYAAGGLASRSLFEICRFSTATPTGGTAQTVIKKSNSSPGTIVTDVRFDNAGLVTAGVVFESPFNIINVTSQLSFQTVTDLVYPEEQDNRFVLAPGEGLCIRANSLTVAGAGLHGEIDWDEV